MSESKPEWSPLIFHVREVYRPFQFNLGDSMVAELELLGEHYGLDVEAMAHQAIRHFLLDESVARVVKTCPGSGRLMLHPDWRRQARKVLSERVGGSDIHGAPGRTPAQEPKPNNSKKLVPAIQPVRRWTLTMEASDEGLRIIQTL